VDGATGAAAGVKALSGHPLLRPAVIDAAKAWRLKPGRATRVTIRFELNCAVVPPVEQVVAH
jgi:hypothetical protein